MAKPSLAEKYALRKSQTTAANNSLPEITSQKFTGAQISPKEYPKVASSRKLLAEKYELRNVAKPRDLQIPGAFGLPIKRLFVSPLRSQNMALQQLYKVLKSPGKYTPKRLYTMDNLGEYKVGKRTSTGTRVGQIARKITGFFASLNANKMSDSETTEPSLYSRPEGELGLEMALDSRSMKSYTDTKSALQFPRELAKVSPSKPVLEDIDEVDLTMRENKHRQEQRRLENEIRKLEQQLLEQLYLAQQLKQQYERKLYLQQKDYEAQLHALNEEAKLSQPPTEELEADQTFSEIRPKASASQNEDVLVQQSQLQAGLEERSRIIAEKEAIIAAREQELIKKSYSLNEKPTPPKEHFVAYRQFLPDNTPFILPFDAQKEPSPLAESGSSKTNETKPNSRDGQVLSVCEDVQNMIQVLIQLKLVSENVKREMLFSLRLAEKELQNTQSPKLSSTLKKLEELRGFLGQFDTCMENSPQDAQRVYNEEKLEGMMDALWTLKNHSEEKSRARARQVKKYDRQLAKLGPPILFNSQAETSKCVTSLLLKAQAVMHQRNLARAQEEMGKVIRMVSSIRRRITPESKGI